MKQTNPYDLIKDAGLKPDELGEQGLKVLSIYDDAAKMLEKRPNDTSVKETTTKTFTKVESAIKKIIKAVQEQKKTAADKEAEAKLKKENSSMTMKEINAGLEELADCDAELKKLKKAKREKSGKKPKQKTRYTKLKEKLLSVITLIPDNLKNDLKVQQQTEKILLSTHRELVKAWGMNKVTAKAGEKAIKEKFEDMEEKANPKPVEKKTKSGSNIYTMSDGFQWELISKTEAKKRFEKGESVYGLDKRDESEALIESLDDLNRFEDFGLELGKQKSK